MAMELQDLNSQTTCQGSFIFMMQSFCFPIKFQKFYNGATQKGKKESH